MRFQSQVDQTKVVYQGKNAHQCKTFALGIFLLKLKTCVSIKVEAVCVNPPLLWQMTQLHQKLLLNSKVVKNDPK